MNPALLKKGEEEKQFCGFFIFLLQKKLPVVIDCDRMETNKKDVWGS